MLRLNFISIRIIQLLLLLAQFTFELINSPKCLIPLRLGPAAILSSLLVLLELLYILIIRLFEALELSQGRVKVYLSIFILRGERCVRLTKL